MLTAFSKAGRSSIARNFLGLILSISVVNPVHRRSQDLGQLGVTLLQSRRSWHMGTSVGLRWPSRSRKRKTTLEIQMQKFSRIAAAMVVFVCVPANVLIAQNAPNNATPPAPAPTASAPTAKAPAPAAPASGAKAPAPAAPTAPAPTASAPTATAPAARAPTVSQHPPRRLRHPRHSHLPRTVPVARAPATTTTEHTTKKKKSAKMTRQQGKRNLRK